MSSRSTRTAVCSNRRDEAVVDTVVLHYFLLVGQADLLLRLLGAPVHVPSIVFDPDEPDATPPGAMSELSRGIDVHHRRQRDPTASESERKQAAERAANLEVAHQLAARGELAVVDMTDAERSMFARLTAPEHVAEFGLRFPLGSGEAACLTMAMERNWTFVSDDNDALRVMKRLDPGHDYERIRRLLGRAGKEGLVSRSEANAIHRRMRLAGFWDDQAPFPTEGHAGERRRGRATGRGKQPPP